MSQPPQPPNQPPQGGFGAPQDPAPGSAGGAPAPGQPQGQPGYGYPQTPAQPPQAPAAPPTPPAAPPAPAYGQQPSYGYPNQQPPSYGYPGQPPQPGQQPPSYGYPGQPGQQGQPGQPPSYGYPNQQPGYGYPGQPPQPGQQQYGMYPPQAQFPGGQPPQGGGNQKRNRMIIIVSAVVALVLIIGGGVLIVSKDSGSDGKNDESKSSGGTTGGGGGDKGKPGGTTGVPVRETVETKPTISTGKLLFNVPVPALGKKDIIDVGGSWATEKTYAKPTLYGIEGFDVETGKLRWKIPLDGVICGASRSVTEDNQTAITFEAGKRPDAKTGGREPCSQIAVLDLDKGKKLWQETMPNADDASGQLADVAISDGVVAAGWGWGSAAYRMSGGEPLWQTSATSKCKDKGFTGGKDLVSVVQCGEMGEEQLRVQKVDPISGKPKWTYDVPPGIERVSVASSSPAVIFVVAGDYKPTDAIAIDEKGEMRSKISLESGKYEPECDSEVDSCHTVAVGNDTLYMPSKEHEGGGGAFSETNEIVAFNLATGKPKWRSDAGKDRKFTPLRMSGDKIIAYMEPTYDKGGKVLSLDPANGDQTEYLQFPTSTRDAENKLRPSSYTEFPVYEHGRLFLGQNLLAGGTLGDDTYRALAFGS
ncbi:outer membrane protein assembly factor BamB family protein [Streptomyces sp. H27-D2]|uniref:outer membrane protein assembly factor BamB family protein n=1 Tax=Streptomyces sp. H27-D2 TaxID=3046304 RepID=UPI002DB8102A|nr:PQQ-binding-like beta-propeller repeat protein [Streptomyces sp. H27-D2]MEC4015217.1 PQQ-binding-like beta-propeller repeat protein [Streptomyces sp. H27-D2]